MTGAALLRLNRLQAKWKVKLADTLTAGEKDRFGWLGAGFKNWYKQYAMFILPFVTLMREGVEAVVFIGGVSLGLPASSIPLPAVIGIAAGSLIGYLIYAGGNRTPTQLFLIVSACFLYLVGAADPSSTSKQMRGTTSSAATPQKPALDQALIISILASGMLTVAARS